MGLDEVLLQGTLAMRDDRNMSFYCPNGSVWVWVGLGECAQDARDMASVSLGLLSIVCFMASLGPQCYKSYRTGNMDSALSVWFLLLWLAGDSCNLIGSFLANQLPLQCYTAVYYVMADLTTLAMYSYFKAKNSGFSNRLLLNAVGVLSLAGVSAFSLPVVSPQVDVVQQGFKGRSLLFVHEDSSSIKPFSTKEIIGFTVGSVSSLLYLSSRIPQIVTNFIRKSTEGVSYFLFALVILGNTTYGLSVLLKNPDRSRGEGEASYMVHHLPWLIGSLGTLFLDLVITVQFLKYRRSPVMTKPDERAPLLENI
ncbi:lysosomal amino acid transporter 1 homolog [Paramormyrops kingsleyae]|uniref:Lysosomal amino acid transporter 1 homolog n=1 Tax=Paramormyrops kingsleyae TaxID=1676925 RepID=A0A3B3S7W5_9TELE|nr:lysosomal amino acid transporter 1 homolog [Paramormyrops kingsleyae]XP_023687166.1 lysosomal amino acid transporter 1 homolog [Paramormyrops kingsleyae]XP_023687167.1 lysosomal amino acid transporter 1 homolog [Paramormyrops kingsleyae]XP_023687168.1 lysosomal amino acid transporter 1 homolog [Paramormyrops kingsleyae]XP_023687169.1 lysosomal amino acid transporter 1 homolog [Paramormyrops kingsleyae]